MIRIYDNDVFQFVQNVFAANPPPAPNRFSIFSVPYPPITTFSEILLVFLTRRAAYGREATGGFPLRGRGGEKFALFLKRGFTNRKQWGIMLFVPGD